MNPKTHINISHRLIEGSEAFKAALKKEAAVYLAELGKLVSDTDFDAALNSISNFRFVIAGIRFTYYRR